MVEVSIVCLIYKSTKLADMVYDSIMKYTPMIHDGTAEFYFIANDPTDNLLNYLEEKKYPYYVNYNVVLSNQELEKAGYAGPEYIRRVYQGYNYGILKAKGKRVVLINSDNFFSEDWLENLLKYSEYKNIVSSTLVEPGQKDHDVFPGAIAKNFGNTSSNFQENDFSLFAKKIKRTGIKMGGAYMPCIFYKDIGIYAGLYPEGNLLNESKIDKIEYGDENFYRKLNEFGVMHITSLDSVVYHLKEGEKDENSGQSKVKKVIKDTYNFKLPFKYSNKNILVNLRPTIEHDTLIKELLLSVDILIYKYLDLQDILKQIEMFEVQTFENKKIFVCLQDNFEYEIEILKKYPNVQIIKRGKEDIGTTLYNLLLRLSGTYIISVDSQLNYKKDYLSECMDFIRMNFDYSMNYFVYPCVIDAAGKACPEIELKKNFLGGIFFLRTDLYENYYFWINYWLKNDECTTFENMINISTTNQLSWKNENLNYENERLKQEIMDLKNSTSWRITVPLRKFKSIIKR